MQGFLSFLLRTGRLCLHFSEEGCQVVNFDLLQLDLQLVLLLAVEVSPPQREGHLLRLVAVELQGETLVLEDG
jgi:hypothetical protein